mgnify:CR=1 FL=1
MRQIHPVLAFAGKYFDASTHNCGKPKIIQALDRKHRRFLYVMFFLQGFKVLRERNWAPLPLPARAVTAGGIAATDVQAAINVWNADDNIDAHYNSLFRELLTYMIEDPRIAAALRFIRQHATENLDVTRVAREVALSRSVLERRMKALIGRSPGEEINRLRFAAVEKLLTQTDLTLDAIAARATALDPAELALDRDDHMRHEQDELRLLRQHGRYHAERQLRRRDGSRVWVQVATGKDLSADQIGQQTERGGKVGGQRL